MRKERAIWEHLQLAARETPGRTVSELADKFYDRTIKDADPGLRATQVVELCSNWLNTAWEEIKQGKGTMNDFIRYITEGTSGKRSAGEITKTPKRPHAPEETQDKEMEEIIIRALTKRTRKADERPIVANPEHEKFVMEALLWKERFQERLRKFGMKCVRCGEICREEKTKDEKMMVVGCKQCGELMLEYKALSQVEETPWNTRYRQDAPMRRS